MLAYRVKGRKEGSKHYIACLVHAPLQALSSIVKGVYNKTLLQSHPRPDRKGKPSMQDTVSCNDESYMRSTNDEMFHPRDQVITS